MGLTEGNVSGPMGDGEDDPVSCPAKVKDGAKEVGVSTPLGVVVHLCPIVLLDKDYSDKVGSRKQERVGLIDGLLQAVLEDNGAMLCPFGLSWPGSFDKLAGLHGKESMPIMRMTTCL
jgi:hypothetical protein